MRSCTVRAFDAAVLELTLDFVVHGDAGVAGPWAATAAPGTEVLLLGPGGGYAPDPAATHHLLAGDESALPAIAVALERLPDHARGQVVVEVPGPGTRCPSPPPPGSRSCGCTRASSAPERAWSRRCGRSERALTA